MPEDDLTPDFIRAALVPELLVSRLDASLAFWCGLCGFGVAYQRPEDRFAYLDRSGAQVMLEERLGPGRHWVTGALEPPFGRGINMQVTVGDAELIRDALRRAGWPLFMDLEEAWYRAGTQETGARQFLVQDPDGYLLRFSQGLGLRPVAASRRDSGDNGAPPG